MTDAINYNMNNEDNNCIENQQSVEMSKLTLAIKSHQVDRAQILINDGIDINYLDEDGWSVLHHAVNVGCIEITKILLGDNKLCKINARTMYGRNSALHIAVSKGYEEIVDELLKANAKNDIKNGLKHTPLRIAVDNDKISIVRKLLKVHSDPNIPDKQGETPLTAAIKLNNFRITNEIFKFNPSISLPASILYQVIADGMVEIACLLTYHIKDINEKDYEGNAPILLASSKGYEKIVHFLISKGCDVNVLDSRGWNALHNAAHSGHINVIRELFLNNFECNTLTTKNENALHLAVSGGHVDIIELLVKVGIDLETKNEEGQSPLQLAVEENQTECAMKLLELGSNPHIQNRYGEKLIHHAIRRENLEFLSSLLLPGKKASPEILFNRAVETKQIDIVKLLLERGHSEELKGDGGLKLFKTAIINNFDLEIFKLLLDNGLNVNATDKNGYTMAHYSALYGKPVIMKALIDAGVDTDHPENENGFTAMHIAACMNYVDIIEVLHAGNCNINALGSDDKTPLMVAVVFKKTEAVKKLIELGANSQQDPCGFDIIIAAKLIGADEIVKILSAAGAVTNDRIDTETITDRQKEVLRLVQGHGFLIESDDDIVRNINKKDHLGWTALHHAAMIGDVNLCVRFLNNGADVNGKADDGATPLHIAVVGGHVELIEVLVNRGADIYIKNNNNSLPIKWAIEYHQIKSCIKLSKIHAQVEKRDIREIYDELELLFVAVNRQNTSVIEFVLSMGADPNKCNSDGEFVLHALIMMKSKSMLETLLKHSNVDLEVRKRDTTETALILAVKFGIPDIVLILLRSNANPDAEDFKGDTPLSYSVRNKDIECAKVLLTFGAKIKQEHSLLHQATLDNQIEIVDLLIEKSDVNAFNEAGDTPLLIAARNGNIHIFNKLLEYGANIHAINNVTESTVLHEVIQSVQDINIFRQFLICMSNYDVDINRWIPEKGSPLYMAIISERENFAILMIKRGANLEEFNITENKTNNYLSLALEKKLYRVASILLWNGMKIPDDFMKNPWTLGHLTRQVIRSSFSRNNFEKSVNKLSVPKLVKMFIVFDDELFFTRHPELGVEIESMLEKFILRNTY